MLNKKAQALVEFVLVFPIFLIIICTIIELGSINYQKYKLENNVDTIVNMYLKDDNTLTSFTKENKLTLNTTVEETKVTIKVTKNIDIVTPVLKSIYSKKYNLQTERVFFDE